jgi:NAD(P)H-dependent flavin oxidoreductase YrpB (nitropropane dioxygenase family)
MTLRTAFTDTFDLSVPIVQAPMGGAAGPDLVAAAANAGALAILPIWFAPPDAARDAIERTRELTARPFAVNLRADLDQHDHIAMAIDAGISLFHLFWGDPAPSMAAIRRAGARMIATVGDVATTTAALNAGADALIAQGVEAGGHVWGTTPLHDLLPSVVALAGHIPVAAAGGIVDADDVVHAFALGASAAVLGTCLVVTAESAAHPDYKESLLAARAGDTVMSKCFDGFWPDAQHRTLSNSTYRMWREAGFPVAGSRPGEDDIVLRIPGVMDIPRYHAATPTADMTGDCEAAARYAGTGVGRIARVQSAAALIRDIATAAAARLPR